LTLTEEKPGKSFKGSPGRDIDGVKMFHCGPRSLLKGDRDLSRPEEVGSNEGKDQGGDVPNKVTARTKGRGGDRSPLHAVARWWSPQARKKEKDV